MLDQAMGVLVPALGRKAATDGELPMRSKLGVKQEVTLPMRDETDIHAAVGLGRVIMAGQPGFDPIDQIRLETIISELAAHVLWYGSEGTLVLRQLEYCHPQGNTSNDERRVGFEITVCDHGSGGVDLASVLAGGESVANGLASRQILSVRQLADEFAMDSVLGYGTRVRARKWVRLPPGEEGGTQFT